MLTSQDWYNIANNYKIKAEWIINNHGRAHAFFHAVRLGPSFTDLSVAE
ncbi:5366_t:CDS:1, partial [Scutellospora calospora]